MSTQVALFLSGLALVIILSGGIVYFAYRLYQYHQRRYLRRIERRWRRINLLRKQR